MGNKVTTLQSVFAGSALPRQAMLRILATTDLHMNLMSWDYFANSPAPQMGLVRTASLIKAFRATAPNNLLFDNGDFLQGNPLSDSLARTCPPAGQHPMIRMMHALGYDAGTLGNHEFNYGLEFLEQTLAGARFPIVSANILRTDPAREDTDTPFVPPYALLDRMISDGDGQSWPIRIGIIGFAPPQIAQWDKLRLAGRIATVDIVAAAKTHVPALRAAGADIVIALCHSGIGSDTHDAGMENAAVPLAAVTGIDAVVTGHAHQVFPGPGLGASPATDPVRGTLHGKPAVMAGCNGSHLGVIDLLLDKTGGRWVPVAHDVRAEPIARRGPDHRVRARAPVDLDLTSLATVEHRAVLRDLRKPIGKTNVALHSYFSLLGPDASLQVVADAQRAKARLVLSGTAHDRLPLLSAVAPFRAGGRGGPGAYLDIPPGPLVARQAAELYLYPNGFCILGVTGAQVQDWLERSASLFLQITAGVQDQPLIHRDFPAYNFDLLDGVTYVIDPTAPPRTDAGGQRINPAACRVLDLRHNGRLVDPGEPLLVATNSYRAGGGGGFAAAQQAHVIHHSALSTSAVVTDHLRRASPIAPDVQPTWRFRSLPGTSAWFDTGPDAASHAAGIPGLGAPVDQPDGFCRYTFQF